MGFSANFLEFFGKCLGIFWNFSRGFFGEIFLAKFFLKKFSGEIFLGGLRIFGRIEDFWEDLYSH